MDRQKESQARQTFISTGGGVCRDDTQLVLVGDDIRLMLKIILCFSAFWVGREDRLVILVILILNLAKMVLIS